MITNAKIVGIENGNYILQEVPIENIVLSEKCILSIDGSTDNTGVGIIRERDGAIVGCIAFKHQKSEENPVQYKVKLKRELYKLLHNNKNIVNIYYEEPFIGYVNATKNLFMLRTSVEEIKYENEPEFDYIKYVEVNNLKWKKDFLAPDKCPAGTELQKQAVKDKLIGLIPFLKDITQDEIDALAMGYVAVCKQQNGTEGQLETRKKARPFKYNIEFLGADEDEIVFQEFMDDFNIPDVVLNNGIVFREISGIGDFNKKVYDVMGNEDKLLILKFASNKYGNLVLKYRLGSLVNMHKYIYAIVWRTTRKH